MTVFQYPALTGPLPRLSQVGAREAFPTDVFGLPQVWWVGSGEIGLRPIPDKNYLIRIEAISIPNPILLTTDIRLPIHYHSALVEGATALLAVILERPSAAAAAEKRFDEWIRRMHTSGTPFVGPGTIRDSAGLNNRG